MSISGRLLCFRLITKVKKKKQTKKHDGALTPNLLKQVLGVRGRLLICNINRISIDGDQLMMFSRCVAQQDYRYLD
jgi:hypothetical protein